MTQPDRRGIRVSPESSEFLLEFDTPGEEFYRGFQCGEIWACLVDGVEQITAIISASNCEMVMRMSEASGYCYDGRYLTEKEIATEELGPGEWMTVQMRIRQ